MAASSRHSREINRINETEIKRPRSCHTHGSSGPRSIGDPVLVQVTEDMFNITISETLRSSPVAFAEKRILLGISTMAAEGRMTYRGSTYAL